MRNNKEHVSAFGQAIIQSKRLTRQMLRHCEPCANKNKVEITLRIFSIIGVRLDKLMKEQIRSSALGVCCNEQ